MRTRHLTIRKEQFDAILTGVKTQYVKELKPATKQTYCEYDSTRELIGPKHFNALKLAFSQKPDKDWLEIEVTGIVVEEDRVVYNLGEILDHKVAAWRLRSLTA